ncbi:hypothetical protein [Sphingomicrobium marinum]|uniref:hypothetical protein n=1 Tax=Sphingomicrobium marinum TaxID=1227950 RepID=UPI00223F85CD|nr:hypothetical protein [Sphingomicrobium marinum]
MIKGTFKTRRNTLAWALPLAASIAIAGCSREAPQRQTEELQTMDASTSPEMQYEPAEGIRSDMPTTRIPGAPGVNVTAAPGVAFDYRYAFRLAPENIGRLVEEHAAACEALGVDQCRIVGLRYNFRAEDDITAMLALKLAPEAARAFGKDATDLIVENEGMLVAQEITGTDAGAAIDAATAAQSRLQADIRRLEQQLEGLSEDDRNRGSILSQIEQLRRQLRASEAGQDNARQSLAQTPMVFHYGAGDVVPGWGKSSPIAQAFSTAWWGAQEVIAFFVIVLGTLLPILLLVWLAALVWTRFGRPRLKKMEVSGE